MPKDFEMCAANGGKVRTMPVKGGRMMKVCIDGNGKTHRGEVQMRKEMKKEMK